VRQPKQPDMRRRVRRSSVRASDGKAAASPWKTEASGKNGKATGWSVAASGTNVAASAKSTGASAVSATSTIRPSPTRLVVRLIARSWHGRVPASEAEKYYAYLQRTGLADYQRTPGNKGLVVQRWVEGEVAHFLLTTFWDSIDAIKQFAGEDYRVARYYPEDDDFLLEREPFVIHAEVLLARLPG
jgi:heme-degrading monooxygenase HmoA